MADYGTSRQGRKRTASHRMSSSKAETTKKKKPAQTSTAPSGPESTTQSMATSGAQQTSSPGPSTTPNYLDEIIRKAIQNQLQSAGLLPSQQPTHLHPSSVPHPSAVSTPQDLPHSVSDQSASLPGQSFLQPEQFHPLPGKDAIGSQSSLPLRVADCQRQ